MRTLCLIFRQGAMFIPTRLRPCAKGPAHAVPGMTGKRQTGPLPYPLPYPPLAPEAFRCDAILAPAFKPASPVLYYDKQYPPPRQTPPRHPAPAAGGGLYAPLGAGRDMVRRGAAAPRFGNG